MNSSHESARPGRRGAVWAVRRVLAPAALELEGRVAELAQENAALQTTVERLESEVHAAEERLAVTGPRMEELSRQIADLREGMHEARRLNLRVAELTDLVTELVLPLHDRQIDPSVLQRLRPDTL
jgi:hypothetical protein